MENIPTTPTNPGRPTNIWLGVAILAIGIIVLMRRLGYYIPDWVVSWEMILIGIGFFIGIRRNFKDTTSIILILIGALFLLRRVDLLPVALTHLIWPIAIIIAGLAIIIRPRKAFGWGSKYDNWQDANTQDTNIDTIDSVAIFWSSRRNILSKNFRGGEVVNIFGGTEINLNQADINGTATIDIVAIFGGVKIIVPPSWDVRVNVVHIFAGTDDKRAVQTPPDGKKILMITGTAIFGGIDIRSY
jgi:predicted membrane protein